MTDASRDAIIRRIMNDNAEYMNGVDRGQVRFGRAAVKRMIEAAIDEASQSHSLPGEVKMLRAALEQARGYVVGNHDEGCELDLEYGRMNFEIKHEDNEDAIWPDEAKCTCGTSDFLDTIDAALTPSPCPGDVGTEPMHADEWGLYGIGFDSHTGGFSSIEARKNGPEPKETVVFVKHEILSALTSSARTCEFNLCDGSGWFRDRVDGECACACLAATPSALSGDAGEGEAMPQPGLCEADAYLEVQRLAYKTGYNEGYSDASDGLVDRDAAEEGWGQYLEKMEAATEAEHLSPLDAARRAALPSHQGAGEP